ncbi:NWD2 protein [Moniliophthora roreri MCA 2997]|uniref:NWD2 protein n=1 Tax=Moniliophthora roreri (strain MCA 2997) TaxID=1381753 RepID=V2WTW0_MONRO|nr:NWD2 protein [Moniliophthora roreri MCA 2997]
MFNGSKGTAIHGGAHSTVGRDQNVNAYEVHGNMTNVYHNEGISKDLDDPKAALKVLAQKAAPNACYDSEQRFPPPNCHPGTRASILGKMSDWIEDNSKPTRVFWLHGSAGVGKSAIAQSLAEKYAGERLAATFFFSRNDETRDRLASFVASIAYQFCKSGSPLRPVLGPFIVETIHSDPNLFHTSCESQFQALIVEPCSKLELEEWGNFPNTIIIDGLDECIDHPSQDRLLAIIRKVTAPPFRLPWLFLIFSRPEVQIRYAFDHEDFGAVLVPLAIQPSDEASQDIREYLVDQFNELRRKYRSILHHEGLSWPSDEAIDQLVKRADGQFIFVITVIKYIDTHDENPQDRLNVILRIYVDPDSESPYSDLDLLYHQILSTCKDWEKAQPILRLLVTPHAFAPGLSSVSNISWRSPEMVALLLNLQMGQVRTILSRLHSVLQIPEDNYHDIHIAHGSFTEFLSDPNRSRGYHTPQVPRLEYCDCVAVLLLRTISTSKPRYFPFPPQSNFMAAFSSWKALLQNDKVELMKYSSDHWYEYCKAVKSPSADLFAALSELDPYLALAVSMFYRPLPYLPEWESVLYWIKACISEVSLYPDSV